MRDFEWCCPFCDRDQIVTDSNLDVYFRKLQVGTTTFGEVGLKSVSIRCTNTNCNEVYLRVTLAETNYDRLKQEYVQLAVVDEWSLRPSSFAKPQPEYIPVALREDYQEACLIRLNSPKAAATLARRCLQGMIRDFCDIRKKRLIDEINTLREQVDAGTAPKGVEAETVDAIDAVRSVGNIGAHMEQDISLIVDVEPDEAQTLIELIEMLFKEWYVARHNRQERLARIQSIAEAKKAHLAEQKAILDGAALAIADQSKPS